MSNTQELEYKFIANHIKFSDFKALMKELRGRHVSASSWDIYYAQHENSWQRFRMDPFKPELTKKIKTVDNNNWVRVESDLPLDPARATEEKVAFHVGLDGYRENFRIFKHCDIYYVGEDLNYVHYIVFDEELRELDRFVEVEVNKNRVATLNAFGMNGMSGAMGALNAGASHLAALGLLPQHRLKKSLQERYMRTHLLPR